MKRSILTLTILLSVLAAATASAQLTTIRFSAPVNPVESLPKLLPSPMTGPLIGNGITLPSFAAAWTPEFRLPAAAPRLPFALPVRLPASGVRFPEIHDGPAYPLHRVTPGTAIRFVSASTIQSGAAQSDASKERLDGVFDGAGRASKPSVDLPRRTPVSSGRHISLPEWDLERELGL
jgi:hypothetical protein